MLKKTYAYERFWCQKIRDFFFLELGQKGTCVTFKFMIEIRPFGIRELLDVQLIMQQ